MKRSLGLAATAVAVAGITFAGVAPANAAAAKTAVASGRDCGKYQDRSYAHRHLAEDAKMDLARELAMPHPDPAKIFVYETTIKNETHAADVLLQDFEKCKKG
ncbi:hypothetical protein ACWC2K_09905 [Streptomyces chattanoogensis]